MTGHTLTVALDGDRITTRVECHEPQGADCRLSCADENCGDGSTCNDDGNVCRLIDSGYCQHAAYLNEDESLIVEWHEAVSEPLTDGMRIVCTWDGGGYSWRGADTPPAMPATKARPVEG